MQIKGLLSAALALTGMGGIGTEKLALARQIAEFQTGRRSKARIPSPKRRPGGVGAEGFNATVGREEGTMYFDSNHRPQQVFLYGATWKPLPKSKASAQSRGKSMSRGFDL